MSKHLICILGPTAIGKTAVSIDLAKYFDTDIISCDSRQFYKEMSIGTAVPTDEELGHVRHHFIQHISIFDNYSVGDYEKDALAKINELFKCKDQLILTGGSGLYQKAVLEGLDHFPQVDKRIRRSLNETYQKQGLKPLQDQLKEKDPDYFEVVDQQNPHRLIRALEICIGTDQPFSSFINKNKQANRNFKVIKIGLTADRQVIYDRIESRVDKMFANGLLEEARSLYANRDLNALQTVGYKELFNHFDGSILLYNAKAAIKKNTRRYAKRQLTWLRNKDRDINWFSPDDIYAMKIFLHEKIPTI
jgi:tRNA dimethylallyltransferase